MKTWQIAACVWLSLLTNTALQAGGRQADPRGVQFIPFRSFSAFTKSRGESPGEAILTSQVIKSRIPWDELIVSWNAETPPTAWLRIEACAVYPDRQSKWYVMGLWTGDPARHPRRSVARQKDADGDVDTDTLILVRPAERVRVRITLGSGNKQLPRLKFLGLSLLDTSAKPAPLPPNRAAWGKLVDVPERSQMAYEGGEVWCSPATTSMLLAHWRKRLNRPELDREVPEVVRNVFDPQWDGTGNWVFNTAYAGSFRGMRAYTARLSDVAEIEDWIARGLPVGLSVCYNRLRGKSRDPSGHLVVCVGFTETGDAIINDPGTRENVRKIFPRANLIDALAYKKNAVYLVYPETGRLPVDRFCHWDSAATRRELLRRNEGK